MTPGIKNRIVQIRQGEVPEGYKQAESGILPNDWSEYRLGDILNIFRGASPRPKGDPRYYGGSIPRLLIEDITRDGKYPIPRIDSLTEEGAKKSRLLPKGSLVMSCSGTQVGIMGFLGVDACIHDGFFGFDNFLNILPEYFYQYFLLYFENLQSFATQGGVFNNLTTTIMKELKCCFPSINEQQKIVKVLITQDKIIELKEKLITEKQRQKKSLMQQLLTGRKRLAGYNKKWCVVKLKNVAKKEKLKNVGFEYSLVLSNSAQYGIIPQEEQFDKEIASTDRIDEYYIVRDGYFAYNPRISTTAPCGPININETGHTGVMSPLYTIFSIDCDYIDSSYMKQYFKSTCWFQHMKSVANYEARHDRMSVTDNDFFAMPIAVPELEEQQAISAIFAVADKEISLLQQSLEKEKQKKKALMQLLLTGIVRV